MWLLSVDEDRLVEVSNISDVRYAILSHRWSAEEVTFDDIRHDRAGLKQKFGYDKLCRAREQVKLLKIGWLWVDTCCIDRTNSAELSEAINSMYSWYARARTCLVHLADTSIEAFHEVSTPIDEWYRRELIAPYHVIFYDKNWEAVGTKHDSNVCRTVSRITRIRSQVLLGHKSLAMVSVAERMSWAADRKVNRPEDVAYSLMGLFDVNMPMLYGEGTKKAFLRLQEQILIETSDHSIFAWTRPGHTAKVIDIDQGPNDPDDIVAYDFHGLLADHPSAFGVCSTIARPDLWADEELFRMTNRGLRISLELIPVANCENVFVAVLNCKMSKTATRIAIYLQKLGYTTTQYARIRCNELALIGSDSSVKAGSRTATLVHVKQRIADLELSNLDWQYLVPRHLTVVDYKMRGVVHEQLTTAARQHAPPASSASSEWGAAIPDGCVELLRRVGTITVVLVFTKGPATDDRLWVAIGQTAYGTLGYRAEIGMPPPGDEMEEILFQDEQFLEHLQEEPRLHDHSYLKPFRQETNLGLHTVGVRITPVVDVPRWLFLMDINIRRSGELAE